MRQSESPPILLAASTPYTWSGSAEAIEYQIRFYSSEIAVDSSSVVQADGARSVTVVDQVAWRHSDTDVNEALGSALESAPTVDIPGGTWKLLGLGLGERSVTFTAAPTAPPTDPAGATHYRILVKSRASS